MIVFISKQSHKYVHAVRLTHIMRHPCLWLKVSTHFFCGRENILPGSLQQPGRLHWPGREAGFIEFCSSQLLLSEGSQHFRRDPSSCTLLGTSSHSAISSTSSGRGWQWRSFQVELRVETLNEGEVRTVLTCERECPRHKGFRYKHTAPHPSVSSWFPGSTPCHQHRRLGWTPGNSGPRVWSNSREEINQSGGEDDLRLASSQSQVPLPSGPM